MCIGGGGKHNISDYDAVRSQSAVSADFRRTSDTAFGFAEQLAVNVNFVQDALEHNTDWHRD